MHMETVHSSPIFTTHSSLFDEEFSIHVTVTNTPASAKLSLISSPKGALSNSSLRSVPMSLHSFGNGTAYLPMLLKGCLVAREKVGQDGMVVSGSIVFLVWRTLHSYVRCFSSVVLVYRGKLSGV